MAREFVHVEHANHFAELYRCKREEYSALCEVVRHLLQSILPRDKYSIHSIDARAKDIESFRKKAGQPHPVSKEKPKYDLPLDQIRDLAGVRVITYVPGAVSQIHQAISTNFEVLEAEDKGKKLEKEGRLGYQSVHLLVRFASSRLCLPEYSRFKELVCEIQIRTILQHAWAELEHDIRYKSVVDAPSHISQRFIALAGLIEIADREFQAIQDEDKRLRAVLRADTETVVPLPAENSTTQHAAVAVLDEGRSTEDENLSPRELVVAHQYERAIEKYTQLLAGQPNSYTLYLGRARALFLNGDRDSALKDLDTADALAPNTDSIARLRQQIEVGVLDPVPGQDMGSKLAALGNSAVQAGDGEAAKKYYDEAARQGFVPVYCAIDQAMALILLKNLREAQIILMATKPHAGSFVEVNIFAIRLIIQCLAGKTIDTTLLVDKAAQAGYDILHSPLRYLKAGLKKAMPGEYQKATAIFAALEPQPSVGWGRQRSWGTSSGGW